MRPPRTNTLTTPAGVAACLLAASSGSVRAETSEVSPSGFTIPYALAVESEPQRVWRAFTQLPL
jgi:hypothetical protein